MKTNTKTPQLLKEFPIPTYDQWLKLVEKQLRGVPFEKKLVRKTAEDLSIKPIYLKSDAEVFQTASSYPGVFPYTRSTRPEGLTDGGWMISQQFAYPEVTRLNEALVQDLNKGLAAIMLVLDQSGKSGRDPDASNLDAIGATGISIFSLEDLKTALNEIDLTTTALMFDAGSSVFAFFALLISSLQSNRFALNQLTGAAVFDPLSLACSEGTSQRSISRQFDEMAGLINWTRQWTPSFRPIGIDARPYAEAGANAVQELAFAIAAAVDYLRELQQRGVSIEQAAESMSLFMGIGADFFNEIAKLRAARTLWAKVIAAFGGSNEAQKLTIHSHSISWNKTLHDPHVNLLRATTEAYSSVLGGCDSLCLAPFDQLSGPPAEASRRIARNIQVILKEECHGHRVIDPAGGAWFLENLTRELSEKAWITFQDIEKSGGFQRALQKNWPQQSIKETAKKRKEQVGQRKQVIVGTNMYPNLDETPPANVSFDQNTFASKRIEQMKQWKSAREKQSGWTSLKDMQVQRPQFFEQITDAVRKGLTLGEINSILAKDNNPLKLTSSLAPGRQATEYETLRRKADAYKSKNGEYPLVFLANLGPPEQHKPRADYVVGFLQPGGFNTLNNNGFDTIHDAVHAAAAAKAGIVVICSTDESYPKWVPSLTQLLKEDNPELCVVVAGYPKDQIETFRHAEVDEFIHVKANHLQLLQKLQKKAGVSS